MMIEQAELRDVARALLEDAGASPDREALWKDVTEAGWPALTAPESAGGLEQPLAAACWLYLELGHALSGAPLLASLAAAEALLACPPSAAREAWLERIIAGERLAVSLVEPGPLPLSGQVVSGRVAGVVNAAQAGHALVLSTEPALVAVVPMIAAGVSVEAHPMWDEAREISDLNLSGVALDEAWVLAQGADAEPAFAAFSAHLHFGIAADCVGAADAALALTVDYLKTRRQFDRPLAMFQALKHRCADLTTAVAAAEALLSENLRAAAEGRGDPLMLARAAKALASNTFHAVAEEAIQLHGGIGMTAEYPCHLYLKRALLNEHLASGNDACDLAVGEGLVRALNG